MAISVAVYADWDGLPEPLRLGVLHADRGASREILEFEFDAAALAHQAVINLHLDPRLGLFEGRQQPPQGHETFGVFADASPDRWGRLLMRRRLEREQRAGQVAKRVRLHESDFLLGVHDAYRVGALRFRLNDAGDFLDNRHGVAAPPFVQLRELEAASLALERDEDNFILVPGKGWRLSEAYDMNPVPGPHGLMLNISEADNAMDIDLVRYVAPYFRVDEKTANEIIERSAAVVRQWPKIATNLGVPTREQERMAAAFQLAG